MKFVRKTLVIGLATLMPVSSVMADSYYLVSGNSMNPTIKDGDIIKVERNSTINNGDIVVGETQDGGKIVKRIEGNQLVGDNKNSSLNFNKEGVKILGEVTGINSDDKNKGKLEVAKAATSGLKMADGSVISSPIKKTFSGSNYTMFLHEDGTITGFGDNWNCRLNYSPCSEKTSDLVKVLEGGNGITNIWAGWREPQAYIPSPDNPELFRWVRLDDKIDTNAINNLYDDVKDSYVKFSTSGGYERETEGSYARYVTVRPDGSLDVRGSDYVENLGIGQFDPTGEHYYIYYDKARTTNSFTNRPFAKEIIAPYPLYKRKTLFDGMDSSFDNATGTKLTVSEYSIRGYAGTYANNHAELVSLTDESTPNVEFKGTKYWVGDQIYGTYNNGLVSDYYDTFVNVWKGKFYAPEDGTYSFKVSGDDAIDVDINGQFVAGLYNGSSVNSTGSITLTQGYHDIIVRQQEWTGSSTAYLSWKKPSDTDFDVMKFGTNAQYDFGEKVVYETNPFAINQENDAEVDWEMRFDFTIDPTLTNGWSDPKAQIDLEVLKETSPGIFEVVYTEKDLSHSYPHDTSKRAVPMPDNGTYKLRVTSSRMGWSAHILDRQYFEDYLKSDSAYAATYYGRTTIVDENGKLYFHAEYWDQFREMIFNDGTGEPVTIIPETIRTGFYVTVAIDTKGRVWYWDNYETAKLVKFPNVDDAPFYDNYKVVEAQSGNRNFVYKVESKNTGKTYAWVSGDNYQGTLGLGDPGKTTTKIRCIEKENCTTTTNSNVTMWTWAWESEAMLLHRDGVPLTDIVSVSAGDYFTVVVQNTAEGQLVWTAGYNGEGRLGGGMALTETKPIFLPGIKDIVSIDAESNGSSRRGIGIKADGSAVYWGQNASSFSEYNFNNFKTTVGAMDKYSGIHGLYSSAGSRMASIVDKNGTPWALATHEDYIKAGYGGQKDITKKDSWNRVQIDPDYKHLLPAQDLITDNNGTPTDTSDDKYYFKNVQEYHKGWGASWILDSQGMLWSHGYPRYIAQGATWTDEWFIGYDNRSESRKVVKLARPSLFSGEHPTSTDYAKGFTEIAMEGKGYIHPTSPKYYYYNTALALKSDGTLWTATYHDEALWNPQASQKLYIQPVPWDFVDAKTNTVIPKTSLPKFKHIDTDVESLIMVAIDENGELWTGGQNGWNGNGVLGLGNNNIPSYTRFYKIDPDTYKNPETGQRQKVIRSFANYAYNIFFVTEDGRVWGMGRNDYGQLGVGDKVDRNLPTEVIGVRNAIEIEGTDYVNYFLMPDGKVKGAGYAAYGELANNFPIQRGILATAFGNEVPIMEITDDVTTKYYSRNSINPEQKKITINGLITEKDLETTKVSGSLLGLDLKKDNDGDGKTDEVVIEGSAFKKDIFDEVIPEKFSLTFDLSKIDPSNVQQDGLRLQATDKRGGLSEYLYNATFVVDDQIPIVPIWGDTKLFDRKNGVERTINTNASTNLTVYEYDVRNVSRVMANHNDLVKMTSESTPGIIASGPRTWDKEIYGDYGPITKQDNVYATKFIGTFYAPEAGTYTFATDADDGSDVVINGNVVASWYGGHGVCNCWNYSGNIYLEKGYHTLEYRQIDGGGGDGWRLGWKKPSDTSVKTMPIEYFRNRDPVRLYVNAPQKVGDNKAPVYFQYQYRKKTNFGYLPQWSEWETVKDKNYVEFFQGFDGETEVKVRSIDAAGNISNPQGETRYFGITDAGGKLQSLKIEPSIKDNKLKNTLKIKGSSFDTKLVSMKIERKLITNDGVENPWELVSDKVPWVGDNNAEQVYEDNSSSLLGNYKYEYRVTLENENAVGPTGTPQSVITMPYVPRNFAKNPHTKGIVIGISQDKRIVGNIKYRLVLVDNATNTVWQADKESNNKNEDIVFDLVDNVSYKEKPEQLVVEGFTIINNSLQIKLLMQGENGKYNEIIYDTNFVNSPAVSGDSTKPEIALSIFGGSSTATDDKNPDPKTANPIDLSLFGTDNQSPPERLQYSLSLDGENWVGPSGGKWLDNYWALYTTKIEDFPLGVGVGKRLIYVRVQDEAGNISYATTTFEIIDSLERDADVPIANNLNPDAPPIDSDFTPTDEIHTNKSDVEITVPKTGNATDVQFSFDGVNWSVWEPLTTTYNKLISFPNGNGNKTIYARYKNEYGSMSQVDKNSDVIKYVLDLSLPEIRMKTANGTLITNAPAIEINAIAHDDLSSEVKIKLIGTDYDLYNKAGVKYSNNAVVIPRQSKIAIVVAGLVPEVDGKGKFHELEFEISDKAGNKRYETIRVFRKP